VSAPSDRLLAHLRERAWNSESPTRSPDCSLALAATSPTLRPFTRSRLKLACEGTRCARLRRRPKHAKRLSRACSVAGARKPVWRSSCSSSVGTARKRPPAEAAVSVETASPAPFPHVSAPRRARARATPFGAERELPFLAAREDSPSHRGGVPRPCWPSVGGFLGRTRRARCFVSQSANDGCLTAPASTPPIPEHLRQPEPFGT